VVVSAGAQPRRVLQHAVGAGAKTSMALSLVGRFNFGDALFDTPTVRLDAERPSDRVALLMIFDRNAQPCDRIHVSVAEECDHINAP